MYETAFRVAVFLQHMAVGEPCTLRPGSGGASTFIFPTWYKYLDGQTDSTGRCAVAISNTDTAIAETIGRIALAVFEIALRVSALIAIGFIIFGGFKFVLSQGDPENAKIARGTIMNAIIGLIIAILATAIVTFVAGALV